jgi:hypothetical protein
MDILSADHVRYISTFLPLSSKVFLRHTSTKFICINIEPLINLHIYIVNDAISQDNPKLLEYLREIGYKLTSRIFSASIARGALKNVQWCLEKSSFRKELTMVGKKEYIIFASSNKLNVLEYLIEVWKCHVPQDALSKAIENKNEDMVSFLLPYCKVYPDELTTAIKSQNINILKNVLSVFRYTHTSFYTWVACETGNMDIVKFLLEQKFEFDTASYIYAIKSGNINLLEFMINEHGVEVDYNIAFNKALEYGHLHILDWVIPNCQIPPNVIDIIINSDYITDLVLVVKWLLSNGYSLTQHDITELKSLSCDYVKLFLQSL